MAKGNNNLEPSCLSRRAFLSTGIVTPLIVATLPSRNQSLACATSRSSASEVKVTSPDGNLSLEVFLRDQGRLHYRVTFNHEAVVEPGAMGMIVDEIDLCRGSQIVRVERYEANDRYAVRGVHAEAVSRSKGAKISVRHVESMTSFILELRAFNDGIAFRYIVPGNGGPRIPNESTRFVIPAESTVWFHDFEGHYEGIHARKNIADVRDSEWAAPPLTVKLPGAGYAAITEAALMNYSGMGLQADGRSGFTTRLGHVLPVSYPFRLRYAGDQERLAKPAAISGTVTTPWRVVMVGRDLNTLVNCDIITSLSPPPDKKLFPAGAKTEWLTPGRAVWKYLDGGENTLEEMKNFSRLASELGFEYNVVEGFWQKWTEDQMRELVDYSRRQRVGIWFWKHSKDLRTPESRVKFFKLLHELGVVGAKIDFFDHEAKEIIDLYQALLEEAARHKIMVDFHGANKPAGESRIWPNEMTREAIRGLEYRNMQTRAAHDTTLPFTRLLAGHADYTPMIFGERRRETSWAHQIASAAIFTSPVLIYGAHPKNILENPAVDMIKSIPSVWDETIALSFCEIGELATFARRSGENWFLTIMNGPTAKTIKVPLSFLASSKYQAMAVRDVRDDAAAVDIARNVVTRRDVLTIELRAGGGFVGRFSRSSSDVT
ncbi:MAG TPA: glycoside hydrolase family 97 catalytic domain-containing protein [Blastocatellia bacterium]|nr:glycoside hydrolase family 97 catalytic domain-containing protein [Blastocatellia bacterium]